MEHPDYEIDLTADGVERVAMAFVPTIIRANSAEKQARPTSTTPAEYVP
ncbi:hypothetical protein [Streptomyces sp. NPDC005262]